MAKSVALSSGSAVLPTVSMSQSTLMVGALFAGFLVWLAMNGKLQAYWSLLLGGGSSSTASTVGLERGRRRDRRLDLDQLGRLDLDRLDLHQLGRLDLDQLGRLDRLGRDKLKRSSVWRAALARPRFRARRDRRAGDHRERRRDDQRHELKFVQRLDPRQREFVRYRRGGRIMPVVALIIGVILVVVAFHNTFGQLASELESDIPGYFKWAIAIVAIVALGYVPALRSPSRWLLGLVLFVILLKNYTQIYAGITSFAGSGSSAVTPTATTTPTSGFVANPATTTDPTPTTIGGDGGTTASGIPGVPGLSANPLAGLPTSLSQFFKLPSLNLGSPIFGTGGAANPSTGSFFGLGN